MNENNQKEVTLSNIAKLIRASADETRGFLEATRVALETKIDSSAAELAAMTQNDLLRLEGKIMDLETEVKEIKLDTEEIKTELHKKVDRFDHNDLIYRVEKLEKLTKKFA